MFLVQDTRKNLIGELSFVNINHISFDVVRTKDEK